MDWKRRRQEIIIDVFLVMTAFQALVDCWVSLPHLRTLSRFCFSTNMDRECLVALCKGPLEGLGLSVQRQFTFGATSCDVPWEVLVGSGFDVEARNQLPSILFRQDSLFRSGWSSFPLNTLREGTRIVFQYGGFAGCPYYGNLCDYEEDGFSGWWWSAYYGVTIFHFWLAGPSAYRWPTYRWCQGNDCGFFLLLG